MGKLSLRCLVEDGLHCLKGLKHGEGVLSWRRGIACCRDQDQAGLTAVVGGTLEEQIILGLGWRWRWRRRRCWHRGGQRNELQAAGCLNHEIVLGGVGGNIKCWLGHNQAAAVFVRF